VAKLVKTPDSNPFSFVTCNKSWIWCWRNAWHIIQHSALAATRTKTEVCIDILWALLMMFIVSKRLCTNITLRCQERFIRFGLSVI